MQYLTDINMYQQDGQTAVTLGKFDGLHRGHQKLIEKVREYASASETIQSVVCAFDMGRDSLLTNEERRLHLENRVDTLIVCPFTKELREMSAERFIEEVLVGQLHAAYIVVGTDFYFGYGKSGDVKLLEKYAEKFGYHLDVIEKEQYRGRDISSTYVRAAMEEGNVRLAEELLGYPYSMCGVVKPGKKLGRTLGFPTMNVAWEERKIAPRFGVYACQIEIDGKMYEGIGNVGVKPTVSKTSELLTEVFVFDYNQDAYGKKIRIFFCEFERPEKKFQSVEELKKNVDADILYGREYFGKNKVKLK